MFYQTLENFQVKELATKFILINKKGNLVPK